MTLVQEVTHQKAWGAGIGFGPNVRARVKRLCASAEFAFAKRLPDSAQLVRKAVARRALPDSTWSTEPEQRRLEQIASRRRRDSAIRKTRSNGYRGLGGAVLLDREPRVGPAHARAAARPPRTEHVGGDGTPRRFRGVAPARPPVRWHFGGWAPRLTACDDRESACARGSGTSVRSIHPSCGARVTHGRWLAGPRSP